MVYNYICPAKVLYGSSTDVPYIMSISLIIVRIDDNGKEIQSKAKTSSNKSQQI
jgi:hypothetical protein